MLLSSAKSCLRDPGRQSRASDRIPRGGPNSSPERGCGLRVRLPIAKPVHRAMLVQVFKHDVSNQLIATRVGMPVDLKE